MAEQNTYDLPVMVGAAVVGLIAIGLFWYMRPEPVAPAPPTVPVTAPLSAQAAPVAMVETSGSGKPGENQGGGIGTAGAGPGGKLQGGGGAGGASAARVD